MADLHDDISIFEQSSPESLRARARAASPHLHNHLNSSSGDRARNVDTEDDTSFEHRISKQYASSRSSISSFPATVIHTIQYTDNEDVGLRTPSCSLTTDRTSKSPGNSYLSAFRNSSSVRALQLESEYADSDTVSLRNSSSSRRSPRLSYFNLRPSSVHSSPTRRSSRPATSRQQSSSKLKKEFPLVLLHCSLLPPAVAVRGPTVSDEVLEAVLPEEYRRRWRVLQDRVANNIEIRQRGVLIPHPREDYELLEESLLETLELERPRIRKGHYLGSNKSGSDSGFESGSQNGTDGETEVEDKDDQDPAERCPDCGKAVSCQTEQNRRWEVKVFAANGLMRSGAWAAAWADMEKVDVEVGVWMPERLRTEVEERLKALQAKEEAEKPVEEPPEVKKKSRRARSNTAKTRHEERMKEIYGETSKGQPQKEPDRLTDETPNTRQESEVSRSRTSHEQDLDGKPPAPAIRPGQFSNLAQEDFVSSMRRYMNIIWHDQKNLAIVLLSMLVLFFSIQNANGNSKPQAPPATEAATLTAMMQPPTLVSSVSPSSLPATTPSAEMPIALLASEEQAPVTEHADPSGSNTVAVGIDMTAPHPVIDAVDKEVPQEETSPPSDTEQATAPSTGNSLNMPDASHDVVFGFVPSIIEDMDRSTVLGENPSAEKMVQLSANDNVSALESVAQEDLQTSLSLQDVFVLNTAEDGCQSQEVDEKLL